MLKEPPAEDDAYVLALERSAVAYAERVTGRHLGEPGERTEYIEGRGGQVLYLTARPEPDDLAVTEAHYPGAEPVDITPDVMLRDAKLIRLGGAQFWRGHEYAATYTHAGAVPDDIRHAVRQLVALWYETRLPLSEVAASPVPAAVGAILAHYRTPKV